MGATLSARRSGDRFERQGPSPRRVDLWYVPLQLFTPAEEGACLELLSEDETRRHDAFRSDSARRQFLAARGLLRTTLSRYGGVAPKAWRFATNRYGRPFIDAAHGMRDLRFSLSHTHGLVVCAVGRVAALGVDVERCDRAGDLESLAATVLAPPEQARFAALAADERPPFFFALWTLKEAYVKARGMGLSLPPDGIWFDGDAPSPSAHFTGAIADEAARWCFHSLEMLEDYVVGIAVSPPAAGTEVMRICAPAINTA